jgi:peptidoglycan/LPS O-acetylase OafA/YrhL
MPTKDAPQPELRKLDYIDALRGYAIAAVVMLHASQALPPPGELSSWLMARGELGVQLFYLASALTLFLSWNARSDRELAPRTNFFVRRFFRIAPMFWLAILGFTLAYGFAPRYWAPDGVAWYTPLLTALFLHGFHPETINSVVPGGWSIAVEMTFYLFIPLLATRLVSVWARMAFVLAGVAISYAGRAAWIWFYSDNYPPDLQYLVQGSAYYAFHTHVPVFALGILVHGLLTSKREWLGPIVKYGNLLLVLGIIATVTISTDFAEYVWSHYLVMSGVFALFTVTLACHPVSWVCNPVIRFLGKVSFSMYLVHIAVLDGLLELGARQYLGGSSWGTVAFFVLVCAGAALVSWPCFRFVETPGIRLGKRVIQKLEARAAARSGVIAATPSAVRKPEVS